MTETTATKMNRTQISIHALFFVFGFSAFLPQGLSAAALLLVLILWLVSSQQRHLHIQRMPPKTIMLLLAAFALWPFIVTAYSGWYIDTTTRLFHMARVALMLQMGLMTTSSERLITFKGLVWGGLFTSLVVLVHHVHPLPEWAIWHHLLAVKGSQSSRAMIMLALASGVCAAMWLKTKHQHNTQPLLWLTSSVLFAIVVGIFSFSRNAQIVLLIMPLILLMHHHRSIRGGLVAIALCVFLTLMAWTFFPHISARFTQAMVELQTVIGSGNCESSVGVRFAMYKMAWDQLLLHPWFGRGIGSFVDYWAPFAQQGCPSVAGIRQPHNDFLLFAMESGWVGLLTTLAVISWFIRTFWRQVTIYGAVGLMLCLTFIITGLVNSPMRDAGIGFVMIFLLASCYKKS
ncbi:O-antigen ligase [Limnohabitans sp. T6-20]|uniref:O-antigen ligase family protein n=1 Tax=Limnohabitans sp. T6-20 TaxID=1100725 RepID=UPI0011B2471C|nr:O-antigen ligase family protein [Limnohabitans sp. T6-20]